MESGWTIQRSGCSEVSYSLLVDFSISFSGCVSLCFVMVCAMGGG